MTLGKQKITIKYKDVDNKERSIDFEVDVVDQTAPLIMNRSEYKVKRGKPLKLNPLCGDNMDSVVDCKIVGDYDVNQNGTYNLKFEATDKSGNKAESPFTLVVQDDEVTPAKIVRPKLAIDELITKHKTEDTRIGIDVSYWQGAINWQQVKDAGVEFVILRMGLGPGYKGEMIMDKRYLEYLKGAKSVGLDVGIYFFSYAKNTEEAKIQAKWILDTLDGEKLAMPIAFDWEDWEDFNSYKVSFTELNNIARAFMDTIKQGGYDTINYGSANYLKSIWNLPEYDTWLANYTDKTTYEDDYRIWQLADTGIVPGIKGDVDLNIEYIKKDR